MENRPAFEKAYRRANELLASSKTIKDFPFDAKNLVKEIGQGSIVCRSFSKAEKYGVDITDFGSESAIIMMFHGKYIIFYDDTESPRRIYFSIIHELGHYVLEHKLNLPKGSEYDRQEIEANFFTAQTIMPEQIIRLFQKRGTSINRSFIKNTFGTSDEAAQKRIETLAKTSAEWRSRAEKEFDDVILFKFNSYINRICPIKSDYYDSEYEEDMQNKRNSWF